MLALCQPAKPASSALMVRGNYVASGLRQHQRGLDADGPFDAFLAAAPGREEVSRTGHVLTDGGSDDRAALGGSPRQGAHVVEAPPQKDAGDDQQQEAAGQPHAHSDLPARPVVAFAVLAWGAEHLTLFPDRIGGLARHAQEVGCLGEEVAQVGAGLADGDALLVLKALALVAHDEAVPVGVVHDAVEGVQTGGGGGPVHPG